MMVTRFDSGLLRLNSMDKDSGSDSDHWDEPPVCQRMGIMVAFPNMAELDKWVLCFVYVLHFQSVFYNIVFYNSLLAT